MKEDRNRGKKGAFGLHCSAHFHPVLDFGWHCSAKQCQPVPAIGTVTLPSAGPASRNRIALVQCRLHLGCTVCFLV